MQNFSNSPAPPSIPPGFSGRGVGGAPYPPQPAEPQISPRMTDDYAGMQQQSLHRGHHHPGQASHMLAYSARNRGAGEPPPSQSNIHSGSGNNPYRKDAMDYYFSMGGKDRHRRGGMSYGGGFGYPTIDGHIPHQYRHPGSSSTPSSGLMSPYPVDYGSGAASGGGAGAFSPSHQYNMNQNPAMQSVPGSQMHRQHGQTFPVHHGQQHRSYTHSGHRMTPQYPHFSPQGGASTGSSGMYSPPPQRYIDGAASTGFDPKVNSSPSVNSSSNSISSSVAANNVGPMENVQQSYHAANYHVYSPQSHSLHKQATLQHRNSQHGLGVGYDGSLKMQHQGPSPGSVYAKHQASAPSIPQPASQELAKSPMHPNAQQTPMNQNFSPISNPSPVASAVHSPSCSSSPSPLMGVPEAHGNPSGHGPSHPPQSNPRSSHGHGRLLQTMPQLSPTPNSNSSISSCGSSASHKAHNPVGGSSLPTSGRNKVGHGGGIGSREEGLSVYSTPSLDKMQDAGLNSLNALSSQVANLPNTIQHMLLTDSVLSQKRKDGGQTQQAAHGVPQPQPRSRNASAASSTSTVKDGGAVGIGDGASLDVVADEDFSLMVSGGSSGTKGDREDQFSEGEHGRVRQMSGASSESEAAGFNQTQTQTERASSVKSVASDSPSKDTVATETKRKEAHIPLPSSSSSSSSPSFGYQSSETGPVTHPAPPVSLSPSFTPSSIPPPQPNCTPETGLTFNDDRGGERKPPDVKKEGDAAAEKTQKVSSQTQRDGEADTPNGQDKENRLVSETKPHNYKREDKHASEEQQNSSNVGVIVSARSEGAQAEKSKHPQDNCVEEKQPHSHSRESSSHNGEEGVDLSMCSPQRQKSKPGRSQNPQPPGSHKYGFSDSTYGSDLTMKNRVRAGPKGVTDSNARFLGYQQSQTGYAHPKDAGGPAVDTLPKRSQGEGSKGQEENSQMQQFPSLLQEVLQGYNLDRRYGRPEQAYPAHHHVHQQFPNRLAFGMTESGRIQSAVPEISAHSAQMGSSGKPPNQKDGCEPNFPADLQSAMKSELPNAKMYQNADKTEVGVSQSHLPQATESQEPPPKHINLADFSLPQKKGSANASNLSSAVQELLLQEPEPLTGTTGQTEPQKSSGSMLASSERRSVICDVSPNRRSTPERDRERDREREKSQSGASVIQQPFSSPAAGSDKKDPGEKHMIKTEMPSKEAGANAAHIQAKHHGISGVNEPDMDYHSKSVHSVGMSADPYRRSGLDMTSHPLGANPLSSPSRHPSYLHGVDLTAGGGGAFPAFRYGDTRESSLLPRGNPHFPPHHPYHHLSPQSQTTSKLQMYAHPRGPPHHPHDMSEWMKAMSRSSKEMMMQAGSSPGRHKVSQSEHRHRAISHGDVPSEQHPSKVLLHHQSAYYEMKMWESAHSGREGARMIEGDPYYRAQPPPPPPLPSPAPVVSHGPVPPPMSHSQNAVEPEPPRGATEEAKHLCPPPPCSSTKPPPDVNSTQPQGQRPTKAGGAGDTNPLMLRRRVRSFISPIPAKRQLQDASQQRAATNSHHSPAAPSESSHHNDDDSSSSDLPCPRLTSPLPGESAFSQTLSPSSGNSKVLPARKGRGLKLEAIVQKITPNVKKPAGHADDESNHYPGFPHSEMPTFNESQDQDLPLFPRVSGGDDSYMDESHSLKSMLPFRGVDEAGPVPTPAYPCDPHQTSQAIKQDFDFGLGAAVGSTPGDKEDFALLGPLPPPPPLPRPVQGSPPPSSSALSDIQHFTNTYQQLETRRGEQSAANLLRQKLQESGMGFEDYPGSDYYGTPPPHQGHMLNRQHQMSSGRSSLSPQDSKPLDNVVPKGYFPSGKKKGRPVGSVNKQKRAQNQVQAQAQPQVPTLNAAQSAPPAPPLPSAAAASTPSAAQPACSTLTPTAPPPPEIKDSPLVDPPVLTQAVKVDVESEDAQPEVEAKPVRRRRKGVKDEDEPFEARGRQRRRRRAPVAAATSMTKDDPDTAAGGGLGTNRVYADPTRKGLFIPHIHVEKKVPEIGAVCTIVNAEEDKMKGERSAAVGKAGGSGLDSLLTSALSSQLSRRDKEAEIRETDEVESALQSGKALPSSGYVVSGPVITETNHSGRLLCCLCQKWANYKHLGDLYGPYYPAEYAAKLPKNQPQIRQCQAATGPNKTGPNSDITSNPSSATQDIQTTQQAQFTKPSAESEYSARLDSELAYLATRVPTAYPAGTNEMMMHAASRLSHTASSSSSFTTSLTWDMHPDIRPIPELKREPDFEGDQQQQQQAPKQQPQQPPEVAQQRPQHRKLTSHPRFKRRHKSSDDSPRMVPSNSKASLPFQPPPPALDSLGPLAQLAQLPQMPMDPEELWVHEGCIVWTSGVYLVNGRLYGLQEALDGARETSCSYCEMVGSTLGCYSKGCTLRYHYLCSMEADCSLNEDNFSLRCPKHKFTQSIRPAKSVYLEQSERG